MADRFPLIVNSVSKKIEELVAGDNLELTGNGIIVSGDTGAGKYLYSDGTTVFWNTPGDVYLTQTQTITNKTLESSTISGSVNTITNIPNSSLINSGITINGTTIALGSTVTTPDNNTTYSVSAVDAVSASEKIIRLTSGGNSGAGVDDDITLAVAVPSSVPAGSNAVSLFIDRTGDVISISGHVVDNNTVTTLNAPGGSATSGAINFTDSGAATVSMVGSTINIDALDTDTRTKIRAGSGGTYGPADTQQGLFTFLASGASSVSQAPNGTTGDPEITYSSTDTVTQIRGGSTGTYKPSTSGTSTQQISIEGGTALGGNVQVTESGNTILIDSTDTDTITRIASGTSNPVAAGDFRFVQSGATTISQSTSGGVTTITISSVNDDTGASLNASGGLILQGTNFRLKNYNNLSGNTLMKWDSGNDQLTDSSITDDGSTVTITGDLVVDGTQTIFNTTVLQVEDNIIELRKGNNLSGDTGGIQVNRTTDNSGNVTAYQAFQWNESGGYWRTWDGSVDNRIVTENEVQILTNKELTAPTLTNPILGSATATSINGLTISSTAGSTLSLSNSKTLAVQNDLTLTSDNNTGNINVNFGLGGSLTFKSDTLNVFASTTSAQLRTVISDTIGTGRLVFQDDPFFLTGINTTSSSFNLLNTGALGINIGGVATDINIGASTGNTTVNHDFIVIEDFTAGVDVNDDILLNGVVNIENADLEIRGSTSDPMFIGRGPGAVNTNTRVGANALNAITSGSQNTAIGYQTLQNMQSGAGNTAVGQNSLRTSNTGEGNTAVGRATLFVNQGGSKNTAFGTNALETLTAGDANVCIGYYAGANLTGSGNVLIGPADSTNPVNDVTYAPPNTAGDRQLVIGSGTEYWIRGNANFDVTLNNDVTVNSDLVVKGNLEVEGTTTTIDSNVIAVSDKAIELASVVTTQFTCTSTNGSPNITAISPTSGLIPGMVVVSQTGGIDFGANCTIVSITGNTAVLSNNVSGSGSPLVDAIGPSDTAANDGGIILNGSTNKTLLWKDSTDSWTSSEDFDLVTGKEYSINGNTVLSATQVGPSVGSAALGSAVTNGSSLTSVGTLTALEVSGNPNFTSNGFLQLPKGTDAQQPGQTGQPTAAEGQIRFNTDQAVFEGYNGSQWGKIGGGAQVQSAAPSNAVSGDLWYDTDDGRMFVYYTDANTSQWVDASPNGTPTDLVVEGTTELRGSATTRAIVPDADDTYNLGGPSNRWANIYSADLQLSNEGSANEVDGTWGQYTIQEGEEDLFLINRRSGKKYKFNLTEVQ